MLKYPLARLAAAGDLQPSDGDMVANERHRRRLRLWRATAETRPGRVDGSGRRRPRWRVLHKLDGETRLGRLERLEVGSVTSPKRYVKQIGREAAVRRFEGRPRPANAFRADPDLDARGLSRRLGNLPWHTFDSAAARAYGRVYAEVAAAGSKARGRRAIDLLIAATAVAAELPLYTRNPSDFDGLSGSAPARARRPRR